MEKTGAMVTDMGREVATAADASCIFVLQGIDQVEYWREGSEP
ncbi:MAG: hypothetical protein P1P84_04245 [Deferrisomatales bacterium]|nr:hypothetical protein [Deferrisomatales bacterium]